MLRLHFVEALWSRRRYRGATGEPGEILYHRCDVSESLDFVVVTPDRPLPTEKARGVLPAEYSRQDVVQNLQRVALLTAAFCSGSGLVPELFRDRIHQPYRSGLIPGIADCLEYRHEGLAGIFLSGAGSSVMAVATGNAKQIGDGLVEKFRSNGVAARRRTSRPTIAARSFCRGDAFSNEKAGWQLALRHTAAFLRLPGFNPHIYF